MTSRRTSTKLDSVDTSARLREHAEQELTYCAERELPFARHADNLEWAQANLADDGFVEGELKRLQTAFRSEVARSSLTAGEQRLIGGTLALLFAETTGQDYHPDQQRLHYDMAGSPRTKHAKDWHVRIDELVTDEPGQTNAMRNWTPFNVMNTALALFERAGVEPLFCLNQCGGHSFASFYRPQQAKPRPQRAPRAPRRPARQLIAFSG